MNSTMKTHKTSEIFFGFTIVGQSVFDSRCYLDGGGSAESLTASEDLKVGSVIGKNNPQNSFMSFQNQAIPIFIYSLFISNRTIEDQRKSSFG